MSLSELSGKSPFLESPESEITRELVIDAQIPGRHGPEEIARRLALPDCDFGTSSNQALVNSAEFLAAEPRTTFWLPQPGTSGVKSFKSWVNDRQEDIQAQYGENAMDNILRACRIIVEPVSEPEFANAPYGQVFSAIIAEEKRTGFVIDDMASFARRIRSIGFFGVKLRLAFLAMAELQRQDAIQALSGDEIATILAEQ